MQIHLSEKNINKFHHNDFVNDQVNDFVKLNNIDINSKASVFSLGMVLDIGGGCGYFARALIDIGLDKVRVIDTDLESVKICKSNGITAEISNALAPKISGDEKIICFNLILHHLIGRNESETEQNQRKALENWKIDGMKIFVNEYIYEGFIIAKISAKLIWVITSSRILSTIGNLLSRFIPSLRANTFHCGVRFRTNSEWISLFKSLGFQIVGYKVGRQEKISIARRLLLIKNCRRDSFLLKYTVDN